MPILVTVLLAATAGHPAPAASPPSPAVSDWSTYDEAACATEAPEVALVIEDEIAADADSPRDCAAPPMPAYLDCRNPAAGFWVDRMIGARVGDSCAAPKLAPAVPLPHFAQGGTHDGRSIGAVSAGPSTSPALLPLALPWLFATSDGLSAAADDARDLGAAFRLERPPRA